MSNGQTIRDAMKAAKKTPEKKDPFKGAAIVDPMGQWKYPGQVTKIPSGDITMQGVDYPVLGVDNFGNQQMMMPGVDYQFPGSSVTEYPMAQDGGWLDEMARGGILFTPSNLRKKVKKKGTSKNIQSSINQMFLRNHTVFGSSGRGVYNPNSKYKLGGWLDNL